MSDDLRVKLGKSKIERPSDQTTRWPHWAETVAAYQRGYRLPPRRFPIIISPDGPISTPEKLQELAGLPSVPEVLNTTRAPSFRDDGNGEESNNPENFQICDVDHGQKNKIRERTEFEHICVWFHGNKRTAIVALSLKTEDNPGAKINDRDPLPIADTKVDGLQASKDQANRVEQRNW